jgi:enolase
LENSLNDITTVSSDYYQAPFADTEFSYDKDEKRYKGKGLLLLIAKINDLVSPKLIGLKINKQKEIDKILKSFLDKNNKVLSEAIIFAISSLVAKLAAKQGKEELYIYLNKLNTKSKDLKLPLPIFTLFNGGDSGDTNLDFQEFLLIPKRKKGEEIIRAGSEIFKELSLVLQELDYDTDTGVEGGYAPEIDSSIEAIELIMSAIIRSGYKIEEDFSLGLDIGSSILYDENEKKYIFSLDRNSFKTSDLLSLYNDWLSNYPISYLEDPFNVSDIESWKKINSELGDKIIIAGDDFFSTNIDRLRLAANQGAANATLIKPGQIGTLTDIFSYVKLAKDRGYLTIMSARSKDSTDTFIVDLSCAILADYIKAGSLSRGERVEKYNRLIEIERDINK